MPISAIDGLPSSHWEEVKGVLFEATDTAGFEAELVSESEESTIIHKTIVHNLYNNPIVICDVSGKNPNVMFELGIRLTFDKATVVVKDDKTDIPLTRHQLNTLRIRAIFAITKSFSSKQS